MGEAGEIVGREAGEGEEGKGGEGAGGGGIAAERRGEAGEKVYIQVGQDFLVIGI